MPRRGAGATVPAAAPGLLDYDARKLEDAQDALTRTAPFVWLEEAEAADEARRAPGSRDTGEAKQ